MGYIDMLKTSLRETGGSLAELVNTVRSGGTSFNELLAWGYATGGAVVGALVPIGLTRLAFTNESGTTGEELAAWGYSAAINAASMLFGKQPIPIYTALIGSAVGTFGGAIQDAHLRPETYEQGREVAEIWYNGRPPQGRMWKFRRPKD